MKVNTPIDRRIFGLIDAIFRAGNRSGSGEEGAGAVPAGTEVQDDGFAAAGVRADRSQGLEGADPRPAVAGCVGRRHRLQIVEAKGECFLR